MIDSGGPRGDDSAEEGFERAIGRYEVLREIGRGGMAVVFLARDTNLARQVALKELSAFHAGDRELAERFVRESRLAGSLSHPNVVTVYDYFEHDKAPYIAMEYVPRGSLRPYVGRLSLAQIAGVFEGVLAGLAHAEEKGIVHRDLKPENIMVSSDGRVKIADFGIAKATQEVSTRQFLTATGAMVGTPAYMAPEQVMSLNVGPWTDLYSMGIMAYELIVGRRPFHDVGPPMALLMRHVNEPIPPLIEVVPQVDPALSGWVDGLLAKEPDERTQSATEAWDTLEEIAISLLGPRWRRDGRLPVADSLADGVARPLTPAPFSGRAPDSELLGPKSTKLESAPADTPGPLPSTQLPATAPAAPRTMPSPVDAPPALPSTVAAAAETAPAAAETAPAAPPAERPSTQMSATATSPPETPPPPVQDASSHPATVASPAAETVDSGGTVYGRIGSVPTIPTPDADAEAPTDAAAPPTAPARTPTPAPAPASRPSRAHASRRRRARIAIVAGGIAVAAAAGFLIGPSSGHKQPAQPLSTAVVAGPVQVSVPANWHNATNAPAIPGLPLTQSASFQGAAPASDGRFSVGVGNGSGPTLLPASFVSRLPKQPVPAAVQLGDHQYYRYVGLTPNGASGPMNVYTLPTDQGVVVGVCQPPAAGGPSFASSCERAMSSLRLSSGHDLPLGPNPRYAASMASVLGALGTGQRTGQARLRAAKTPGAQAQAARALAQTYGRAAADAAKVLPGPAERDAHAKILSALRAAAAAYGSAATAAAKHARPGFTRAESAAAAATKQLRTAVQQLSALGYRLT